MRKFLGGWKFFVASCALAGAVAFVLPAREARRACQLRVEPAPVQQEDPYSWCGTPSKARQAELDRARAERIAAAIRAGKAGAAKARAARKAHEAARAAGRPVRITI